MEGAPQNEEKENSKVTKGLVIGAAVGLAAIGGKVLYDSHQETQEVNPSTTAEAPLEALSKPEVIKMIVEDGERVIQLERILSEGKSAFQNPQNMLVEEFLRPYEKEGTMPTPEAIHAEINRLQAEIEVLRTRRTILDAIEKASQ